MKQISLMLLAMVICVGCSLDSRNNLTPAKALLGHWIDEHENGIEYYFTEDQMIMIEKGKIHGPSKYMICPHQHLS